MKIEQKEIVKVALGIIIGAAAVASCWQLVVDCKTSAVERTKSK